MTKEEKIKEAYGEYWETLQPDENGWSNKMLFHDKVDFSKYATKAIAHGVYKVRPKSLQGIENNNRWIKIESEEDLPEPEKNVLWLNNENYDTELSSILTCGFDCQDYTHWQPLPENPPIY